MRLRRRKRDELILPDFMLRRLEFMERNVDIGLAVAERKDSGKTATDFMLWEFQQARWETLIPAFQRVAIEEDEWTRGIEA